MRQGPTAGPDDAAGSLEPLLIRNGRRRPRWRVACGAAALCTLWSAAAVAAEVQGELVVDAVDVASGGKANNPAAVGALEISFSGNPGAHSRLYGSLLVAAGDTPNDAAGTLGGINNIEVSDRRARVFELWAERSFGDGHASVLAGLFALDSEFYVNDAAALFIAPAFGMGSELAATGSAGPGVYPSAAPALRLAWRPGPEFYVQAAVLNARAGSIGDAGGVDFTFDEGVLEIIEGGWEGEGKLAFGAWRYSKDQPDLRQLDSHGDPLRRRAWGVYLLAEHPLWEGPRPLTGFVRAGLSDGDTSAFRGGWQAGVVMDAPVASRPDGVLGFAVNQALLSNGFRRNLADAAVRPADAETQFDLTYSDTLGGQVSFQPDLMWTVNPGGDADAPTVFVAQMRFTVTF